MAQPLQVLFCAFWLSELILTACCPRSKLVCGLVCQVLYAYHVVTPLSGEVVVSMDVFPPGGGEVAEE